MNRTVVRIRRGVAVVAAAALVLVAIALGRSRANARDPPLSPVTADWQVGSAFVEQRGLHTGDEPTGELADVGQFAGGAFDPDRLHPEVRRFYGRTGDYEMRYRVRWHRPFRTGAALASRLTSRIEQLNLPPPGDESWHRLESRFVDIVEPGSTAIDDVAAVRESAEPARDPVEPTRENVRAWIRTDAETGEAVFVALYGTHHRDGKGFVNIAVPIPGGGVDTVLRPESLALVNGDATWMRLTTEDQGDPGLYIRTPMGPIRVPGGQRFDVRPTVDGSLGATHEMWLFGRTFLTVEYDIERAD